MRRRLMVVIAWLLAAVLLVAGVSKLIDPARLAMDITAYRLLPAAAAQALAVYLPWLEVACGCFGFRWDLGAGWSVGRNLGLMALCLS